MSHLLRKAALSAIGSSLLVATLGLAPAGAEKPDTPPGQAADHGKPADRHEASDRDGDADSDSSTTYTEDNDTNDGGTANNVADDGDNAHPSGRDRSVENGASANQGRSESDPDDNDRGPERSTGQSDKPNGDGGVDRADQDGNNGCGNDDDFEDDNEGWCGKPADTETPATPDTEAETTPEAHKPCPNGSMTRPCAKPGTDVDDDDTRATPESKPEAPQTEGEDDERTSGAPVTIGCPAADDMDDDDAHGGIFGRVCALVAGTTDTPEADEDDTQVLGAAASRGGAAGAEAPASTVSARSAGGVLAGLPVVGSVIEGQLPFTGISTLGFLIVAMAAMVIGFLLVRASRRAGATS